LIMFIVNTKYTVLLAFFSPELKVRVNQLAAIFSQRQILGFDQQNGDH